MKALTCDVLSCENATSEEQPGNGWLTIECVSHFVNWAAERRTLHACNPAHGIELLEEIGEQQ